MGELSLPRPLVPEEKALLEFLLSADFPGRDGLSAQVDHAEVVWECDCGCGTVNLSVREPVVSATAREPIPIEAHAEGLEVLLFVRNGLLQSLEIVDYEDRRPLPYPTPAGLRLWVPPAKGPSTYSGL